VIPKRYKDASVEMLVVSTEIQEKATHWVKNPGASLILTGRPGSGKTHTMYAMANGLLKKYHESNIYFFKAKGVDDRILQEIDTYKNANYFISMLCEAPFLFLDDLGVEKTTERAGKDMLHIIDSRSEEMLPTVISTNLAAQEIEKHYGGRFLSRLKEYEILKFLEMDLRGRKVDGNSKM